MSSFIALRVPLLVQIFYYVFQQHVAFFFMGSVRINFVCHFSPIPDQWHFNEILDSELMLEWLKNSGDVEMGWVYSAHEEDMNLGGQKAKG